jgi:hypothetical protein
MHDRRDTVGTRLRRQDDEEGDVSKRKANRIADPRVLTGAARLVGALAALVHELVHLWRWRP